ncbi:MAG: response regulator [Gemmatimonadales bacterium]
MRRIRTRPVDVLLVDDTDDDVVLTRAVLAGTERLRLVHVAPGGQQALEYLRRQGRHADAPRPDLILADVNMPGMSGFELLEAISATPTCRPCRS